MKNRVLLTMLIIFIVLSGVCFTCGTIFVVREIEIVDTTPQAAEPLTQAEKDDIVARSGLLKKNILFNLNQQKIAQGVKSVNPMIKLQSVRAKFPNRVILQVSRRVPIYRDDQYYYDAEMCRVDGTKADYIIDITKAGLQLSGDLKLGDIAVGKNEYSQCKINQLKIIATYFTSLKNFEIAYTEDQPGVAPAGMVCLELKIKSNVTFRIKIGLRANFLYALQYTDQIYQRVKEEGTYETRYRDDGKVVTVIGEDEYHE